MNALLVYLVVGLAAGLLAVLRQLPNKKGARRWTDGLLSTDRRSFETISKQHQRMP